MFSESARRGIKFIVHMMVILWTITSVKADETRSAIIFTSDTVLSSGYVQARLIRDTIAPYFRQSIQLQSHPNHQERLEQLLQGKADACFCGASAYLAQEGLMGYDTPVTGPAQMRQLLTSTSPFAFTFAMDESIRKGAISNLKKARVAWLREDSQYNFHTTALLAFGGLGWQDVQQIVFPDYEAALEGFERNYVDALLVMTTDPGIQKIVTGKRFAQITNLPKTDKAGWQRMQQVAPYLTPFTQEESRGIPAISGASFPYPALVSTTELSEELAYNLTKAMVEQFETYVEQSVEMEGWNVLFQNFQSAIPFHEGSIRYFKELELWSEAAEQHQMQLLRRQFTLRQAFDQQVKMSGGEPDFSLLWRDARDQALGSLQNPE